MNSVRRENNEAAVLQSLLSLIALTHKGLIHWRRTGESVSSRQNIKTFQADLLDVKVSVIETRREQGERGTWERTIRVKSVGAAACYMNGYPIYYSLYQEIIRNIQISKKLGQTEEAERNAEIC